MSVGPTPEPWRVVEVGGALEIWGEGRLRPIAVIERGEDDRQDRVNADLIAAAPVLFAAAEKLDCAARHAPPMRLMHYIDLAVQAARAAIAKATGK